MQRQQQEKQKDKQMVVCSLWLCGPICKGTRRRPTLYLPLVMAKQYGLDKPCQIIVENRAEGLLVRKLE
jgi:hypothetical protein